MKHTILMSFIFLILLEMNVLFHTYMRTNNINVLFTSRNTANFIVHLSLFQKKSRRKLGENSGERRAAQVALPLSISYSLTLMMMITAYLVEVER